MTLAKTDNTLSVEITKDEMLIQVWLSEKSEATKQSYLITIKQFLNLVPKSIVDIGIRDIQLWKEVLISRYKIATANNKLTAIKSLMSFALRIGYIRVNPASVVGSVSESYDKEKQSKAPIEKIISNDDVRSMILNARNQRNSLMVKVAYLLGLRITELINLHHNDFSKTPDGNYQVRITGKSGKVRFNNLSASVYEELLGLSSEGFIFQSNRNKPLSRTMAHYVIKDCANRAGLSEDVSAHYLRHCHASHSLNNGASLKSVQKQLGHSSIAITSIYLHDSESSSNYIEV